MISPEEVEQALMSHAGVDEAAVIGLPDLEWGLAAACETVEWVSGFDFPEVDSTRLMVSLSEIQTRHQVASGWAPWCCS